VALGEVAVASDYRARVLPEPDYDRWTRLVTCNEPGSIYHTPAYLDALCAATGGGFRILGVEKGERLVGGLALYEEERPTGRHLAPRLLLYYNGVVVRDRDTKYPSRETSEHLKVVRAIVDWLDEERYDRVVLKSLPTMDDVRLFRARGWRAYPTWSYVVGVDDLDATWERMDNNLRRLVRRARDEGLTVTEDDDFDSFYRLHGATMSRKDRATYLAPERFRAYFERLAGQGLATLLHTRLPGGRAVATTLLLLGDHPVAHTVSAAAEEEHQRLGTNPLLRWRGFQSLHERGYRGVDLTDATLNPVTRFKSQLGGDLVHSLEVAAPTSRRYRVTSIFRAAVYGARRRLGRAARSVLGTDSSTGAST